MWSAFSVLCSLLVWVHVEATDHIFSVRYNAIASNKTTTDINTRSTVVTTWAISACLKTCTINEIITTFPNFCFNSSISWISTRSAFTCWLTSTAISRINSSYTHRIIIRIITAISVKSTISIKYTKVSNGVCSVNKDCVASRILSHINITKYTNANIKKKIGNNTIYLILRKALSRITNVFSLFNHI